MVLITYFGLLLGFLLFILILTYKRRGRSHRLLAAYLLFLSIATAEPIYQDWTAVHIDRIFPDLLGGLYFLVGPLLLFYACALIGTTPKRPAVHTLVFVVYILAVIVERFSDLVRFNDIVDFILYEFLFVHVFVYLRLAFRTLLQAQHRPEDRNKLTTSMRLSWGKVLIVLSAILFGATFIIAHISLFTDLPFKGIVHPMQVVLLFVILSIGLLNTEMSKVKDLV
ncbi:MAG: hypothetical protein KDC99_15690 [Cyclobacteriaceae bacterium]|nr:hypothetical protein [Cyclobacteriaceae bacterium]